MKKLLSGRLIVAGLGLTLCAKAALSFPILPLFQLDALDPEPSPPVLLAAAEKSTEATLQPAKDVPPVIETMQNDMGSCDAPEEVLLSISKERELLAAQRGSLEERRSEIDLAQERLAVERDSLSELRASIEDLLARVEAAQTDDLNRLIDFYKNMKPADAARIIDDLDIETTIMILGEMQPRAAAPILAKVSPVRARAISKIILERSQLPGDQDLNGIKLK